MTLITLPDRTTRHYSSSVRVSEVAADIGSRLADAALAAKVDHQLVDTSFLITQDCELQIITDKDEAGLEVIRHSAAHLLAHAVKILFPQAQVTIGPVIENGFFYDFAYEPGFTEEHLKLIEAKMNELAKENHIVERYILPRDEAIQFFKSQGEAYKAKIIENIPLNETLSLYKQGSFTDICRGPHVSSTGKLKAFHLTKVAGAYWKGDPTQTMLQRIYGTAWADQKSLNAYLNLIEEAEKRDHRKIGKQLDLFHIQEEAPGMPFWHPHGLIIYREIETFIRNLLKENDYQEVRTPQILDKSLWEKSGHWEKFSHQMFSTNAEEKEYAIKPMNCPGHIQIFNVGLKSYKELPLRLAEFGSCFRNEPSGSLHGLMRCRNFVQDDAHIFCTLDQVQSEVIRLINLVFETYSVFGFNDIIIKFSTRPEKRVGSDEIWDQAESALIKALDEKKLHWILNAGDGAFYGPKIEFHLKDCLGRLWQCGTIQLDFNMPERLQAHYIAENGSKQTPIMIHRVILGTMERFIAILIEHHAGILPLWLSPIQVMVVNITDSQTDWCQEVVTNLKNNGLRATSDLRNEKIGYKIREHTLKKVPYFAVIGDQEVQSSKIKLRKLNGTDLGLMSVDELTTYLKAEIESKNLMRRGDN